MNPSLEQLHDIDGLDFISPWPLAMGWWMVGVFAFLFLGGCVWFISYKIAYNRSWKSHILKRLSLLERDLNETTARDTLITLSEYMRRIALKRFSRRECAGLTGTLWLKWLSEKDPKKFDWEKKGALLIEVPYAPPNRKLPAHEIKDLISAVRNWVF